MNKNAVQIDAQPYLEYPPGAWLQAQTPESENY